VIGAACTPPLGAAAQRFLRDLERSDIAMDWDAVAALDAHFRRLSLVGEASGDAFELHPWQLWTLAQIVGWRAADGRRRIRLAMVQVARGNGKTTLMAGLALWDLLGGEGRRVHVIANNEDQAGICLDTARTMAMRLEEDGLLVRFNRIVRPSADCEMTALPALERSLDGLNPSLWIADEAAEFKGRFLTKLLTTGAKRRESTGVVITTPGSNPENHYAELVKQGEAILAGEVEDDTVLPILYGLDPSDQLDEEATWAKANPGHGARAAGPRQPAPQLEHDEAQRHGARRVQSIPRGADVRGYGRLARHGALAGRAGGRLGGAPRAAGVVRARSK
jgi:phage terminase large subunit-like protein